MPIHAPLRGLLAAVFGLGCVFSAARLDAVETFTLQETADGRSWSVEADVTGKGVFQFQPPQGETKPVEQKVEVTAKYRYTTCRLPGTGRDANAYRAVRKYSEAVSSISVGDQKSSLQLRADRGDIVATATEKGVSYYCTQGPLTATEVELLPYPGEDVLLAALLPESPVTVGQTWTPDSWTGGALAASEVALKTKLTCQLDSVKDGHALINVEGEVDGLARGTTTNSKLRGQLRFDLAKSTIVSAAFEQNEKRAAGPLNPGINLTLITRFVRRPVSGANALPTEMVAAIPSGLPDDALRLEYRAPWGVTLAYPREWQVYKQTGQMLIIRLLDSGTFIAQANLAPVARGPGGAAITLEQFEADIRASLGKRVKDFKPAEQTKIGDLTIHRLSASGLTVEPSTHEDAAEPSPRLWRYYLITSSNGTQAVLVVTTEPSQLERLADRDLELLRGFTFDNTPAQPTKAAQSK